MGKEKILVVDDDPGVCQLLKQFLEPKGYVVITASSGAEGLNTFQQQRPNLTLLDVLMPGMDGLETLQRIRDTDRAARVIMLTAVGDEAIKEAALKEAYDYITKPFDFDYLEVSIMTCLAQTGRSPHHQPGQDDRASSP